MDPQKAVLLPPVLAVGNVPLLPAALRPLPGTAVEAIGTNPGPLRQSEVRGQILLSHKESDNQTGW